MRKRIASAVLLTLVLFGAAGCGGSSGSHASSSSGVAVGQAGPAEAKAPAAIPTGGAGGTDSLSGKAAPTIPADTITRDIVYNGAITIRVSDVDTIANRVDALATGVSGYVGSDQRSLDSDRSAATVTLRVPAAQFEATMSAVAALGKPMSRNVSTEDVTGQVIDVQSRLKTQQASVDRIRALLARATTIANIVSIESELTQREADLESLEAQMRQLSSLTSLSTIVVTIVGKAAQATPTPHHDRGFLAGLRSGWHTFVSSVGVLLTVIGALLPFAVLVGVVLWLVMWFVRRRRRGTAPVPAVASAPTPPDAG